MVDDDDDDDGDDEAEERLDEARAEEEDDLREVILNIIRKWRRGGPIGADEMEELSEVATVYFGTDAFERAFDGIEGQSE